MKLCIVNPDFIPVRNSGQSLYGEKIARGLAGDHQVTFVASRTEKTKALEAIDGIRVHRIGVPQHDPSGWLGFGYAVRKVLSELNKFERFDVVHFLDGHLGYAYKGSFVATLHQSFRQRLCADRGLPYHSSPLNLIKRYLYYRIARLLEKKSLRKGLAFISVSHTTRDEFVRNYRVRASKIEVIHNGIDTDFFKPTDERNLRKTLGLRDEKVLLYVGFTTPRKGPEDLVQAIEILKDRNLKLLLVGKWEKGYRERFFTNIGKIRDKIIEAGYVKDEEMPAYYSLADIFVLPTLLEGFGFPLVEAMACGTPVISTTAGAVPEIVGDCGILVPPRHPVSLALAIDRLLRDRGLVETLRAKARKRACKKFSEKRMIQKTIDFYQRGHHLPPRGP